MYECIHIFILLVRHFKGLFGFGTYFILVQRGLAPPRSKCRIACTVSVQGRKSFGVVERQAGVLAISAPLVNVPLQGIAYPICLFFKDALMARNIPALLLGVMRVRINRMVIKRLCVTTGGELRFQSVASSARGIEVLRTGHDGCVCT